MSQRKRAAMKGKWLNTETIVAPQTHHPCGKLGYCPYGQLVEEFPLHMTATKYAMEKGWYAKFTKKDGWIPCGKRDRGASPDLNRACQEVNEPHSCGAFGHDCPVHYLREDIVEDL